MIAAFRSPLIADIDGGLPYTLAAPLVYDSALLNRTFIVPTGRKTDLASVPRALWEIWPPFGSYTDAAVVHDDLYQVGHGLTRAQADGVLNEAMGVLKVGRVTRWAIYSGVRLGGAGTWNRYRSAEPAKA